MLLNGGVGLLVTCSVGLMVFGWISPRLGLVLVVLSLGPYLVLLLAVLTSLPNVIAAFQLAREGRGAAVVSEAMNSNSLNLLAGVCVPALVFGLGPVSGQMQLSALWLLGTSLFVLAAASRKRGLGRRAGAMILALYGAYVVALILV